MNNKSIKRADTNFWTKGWSLRNSKFLRCIGRSKNLRKKGNNGPSLGQKNSKVTNQRQFNFGIRKMPTLPNHMRSRLLLSLYMKMRSTKRSILKKTTSDSDKQLRNNCWQDTPNVWISSKHFLSMIIGLIGISMLSNVRKIIRVILKFRTRKTINLWIKYVTLKTKVKSLSKTKNRLGKRSLKGGLLINQIR